jgi:hypothetical protein
MKKKFTLLGMLFIVFISSPSLAQNLSLTSSNSYQTAINLTYSNQSQVGNRLVADVEITNTSGTWIYIEEDLTSSPTGIPYTDYLLGPNGTLTFQNVSFGTGNFLEFNVTTAIGLDFTDIDPKCQALFGALTVDYLMRGLLTTQLPANAFDNMSSAVDPLLTSIVSSLGNVGALAAACKDRSYSEIALALANMAANSNKAKDAFTQILQKYVASDQVDSFFGAASDTLGYLTQILDVSEKIQLLNSITQSTFKAPLQSANRLDLVLERFHK